MIISQVGLFHTKITCSPVHAQPWLLFPNCLPARWRADVIVKCKSWAKTRTLNTAEWNGKPAISSACGHGSGSRSGPLSSCHSQNSWLGKACPQIFVTHWFHTDELLRWEIAVDLFACEVCGRQRWPQWREPSQLTRVAPSRLWRQFQQDRQVLLIKEPSGQLIRVEGASEGKWWRCSWPDVGYMSTKLQDLNIFFQPSQIFHQHLR